MTARSDALSAILIAGPTASGKSALALGLAGRLGGVIINADSMQVYRDLRVLTARPSPIEEGLVPHRLFGSIDGAVNYSLGQWLKDATAAVEAARSAGQVPILVGGTGLYFKALTQGLSDIPSVPPEVRARVRGETAGMPPSVLHARLAARDPQTAARLRPTDPQRIVRALEVLEATGSPLALFQEVRGRPALALPCVGAFLAVDRKWLAARIDERFEAMMERGALGEVAALASRRLDPALPVMRAHGVPPLMAHLRGEIALDAAIARTKLDTRHYVKRQFTFARHQLPGFSWVAPQDAEEFILRALKQ